MITTISGISVLLLSLAWVLATNILPSGTASQGNICTPSGVLAANYFRVPSAEAAENLTAPVDSGLPNTFFFTHYEFIGDPAVPEGVKYSSDGKPVAKAPDGSSITLSGQGAWEPTSSRASGGGQYTIKNAAGAVTAQGQWHATSFISLDILPLEEWWGIPGFREEGWQGGPGSVSYSGFLAVNVKLDNLGDGVLRMWCLMPTAGMMDTHVGDGFSLSGNSFNFGATEQAEMTMFQNMEGVMFYSTDVNATGWVQNPAGIAVLKDEGLQGFKAPSSPDNKGYNPK